MYKNFTAFRAAQSASKRSARAILAQRLLNIGQQISSEGTNLPEEWARSYAGVMQLQYDSQGQIQDVTDTTAPGAVTAVDALISTAKDNLETYKRDLETLQKQWDDAAEPVTMAFALSKEDMSSLTPKSGSPQSSTTLYFDGNNFVRSSDQAIIPIPVFSVQFGSVGTLFIKVDLYNANQMRFTPVASIPSGGTSIPLSQSICGCIKAAGDKEFNDIFICYGEMVTRDFSGGRAHSFSAYVTRVKQQNVLSMCRVALTGQTTTETFSSSKNIALSPTSVTVEATVEITSEVELGLPNPDAKIAALNALLS